MSGLIDILNRITAYKKDRSRRQILKIGSVFWKIVQFIFTISFKVVFYMIRNHVSVSLEKEHFVVETLIGMQAITLLLFTVQSCLQGGLYIMLSWIPY